MWHDIGAEAYVPSEADAYIYNRNSAARTTGAVPAVVTVITWMPGRGSCGAPFTRAVRLRRSLAPLDRAVQPRRSTGPTMVAGSAMRSKSAAVTSPEASAASRRVVPSSSALCAMAEALS